MRGCSINQCQKKHYAKGYCSNHYQNYKRTGLPLSTNKKICGKEGCTNKHYARGYCRNHYVKVVGNILSRNRLEKLTERNFRCEICDMPANVVHHLDKKRISHKKDNLMVVCVWCHRSIHSNQIRIKKFLPANYVEILKNPMPARELVPA